MQARMPALPAVSANCFNALSFCSLSASDCAIIGGDNLDQLIKEGIVEQREKVGTGRRLLIVDDDEDLRMLLAGYFRRIGYEVEERESAFAAVESATTRRFDCFIFDVSMPGMTGFNLLKRVRDRGITTPAMFLTAHDTI